MVFDSFLGLDPFGIVHVLLLYPTQLGNVTPRNSDLGGDGKEQLRGIEDVFATHCKASDNRQS